MSEKKKGGSDKPRARGDGHRTSPGGSFVIDKIMTGVGRIHRASGIKRESQWQLFKAALEEMDGDERWIPALTALKEDRVTGLAVYMAFKKGSPSSLAVGEVTKPLVRALADWRDASESEVAADTHRVRKELVDKVREVAPADATVASLAVVLRVLRGKMAHAPRQFNLIRDYARAFVRDTLGRRHELYADVADITPRKTKKKGRTITDVETRPLTPREVQRLAAAFDIAWRSKKGSRGAEAIAMALTGTNPKEYFDGGLRSLADRVHIAGTKQGGRKRDVPRLFPTPLWPHESLAQPEITQSSFARALRIACAATGIECTPYDFRRTFANWLEAAEIPRARRKLYRGHQSGDIGDLYERHEVTAFLLADGAKVRAWIEAELRNSPDNSPNHPGNSTPAVANGEAGAQRVIE